MQCPLCGCTEFYLKDPDDEYDIYAFSCKDGRIVFDDAVDAHDAPAIDGATETYGDKCAWHGKVKALE